MPEADFTFVVKPERETTFSAGEYDRATGKPSYRLDLSVPEHVRHYVEVEQFLLRTGDGYLWTWRIKNRSTYAVFGIVTVDGKLLKRQADP